MKPLPERIRVIGGFFENRGQHDPATDHCLQRDESVVDGQDELVVSVGTSPCPVVTQQASGEVSWESDA